MARINPKFSNKLKDYGAFDLNACYNCGTCTSVCSLSDEENSFPRKMVRYSVLGLEDEIQVSLEPWLCYYCGECSTTCPRQADPGELMMSLRRWLTSKYDWTGLSGLFYKSLTATLTAFILITAGVLWFASTLQFASEKLLHFGHYFEMIAIAFVFVVILIPDVVRMWWKTIYKQKVKAPISAYIKAFGELLIHMFTQKRTLGCNESKTRWLEHFILVIGYLTLLFTTVFLNWFSTKSNLIIVLGYIESAVIFIVTAIFVWERIRKKQVVSKHTHPSDWFFVIWLLLMGFTAFTVRLFIDFEILQTNIWIFLTHIIILAQWALIIVPFGKWTHFLFRSFAMYFQRIKELAG